MLIFIAGIFAGLIHVFSGPDHLAAIAPLVVKHRTRAWVAGLRWGVGHASGVAMVGLLSLTLRGVLPVDLISNWSDRIVGAMLIGIGLWAFRKAPGSQEQANQNSAIKHPHVHAAFGIGALHGLAGSSHFLAILPSLALPSNTLAAVYLTGYGIGTVLAMTTFSSAMACLTRRFANLNFGYRGLMIASAAVAVAVGCFWASGFNL